MRAAWALAVSALAILSFEVGAEPWGLSIEGCHATSSPGGVRAVNISFTADEFVGVFSTVFSMSDGSTPVRGAETDDAGNPVLSTPIGQTLSTLGDVGFHVSEDGRSATICESDLLRLAMLGVLGNFVASPSDGAGFRDPASTATVVVDVYTGRLVVVPPYSELREYFLETLLVLSVVVMARLSMVRSVVVGWPSPQALKSD